ncbi:hypothetical protein EON83_26890 [bacterium]|nr:MAG: hypothetical protein EON83_26890 [bacterium]
MTRERIDATHLAPTLSLQKAKTCRQANSSPHQTNSSSLEERIQPNDDIVTISPDDMAYERYKGKYSKRKNDPDIVVPTA